MGKGLEHPPEARGKFLAAIGAGKKVQDACELAGVGVATVYNWRRDDADFRAQWLAAVEVKKLIRAEKGWSVVEKIADDANHKDQFGAAKFLVERNDTETRAESEEGDRDGIAEAIDRFTALVAGIAQPARRLPLAAAGEAGRTNLDALGPGES